MCLLDIPWINRFERFLGCQMEPKRIFLFFLLFLIVPFCDWELLQVVLGATNEELAGKNTERMSGGGRERGEMKSDTWASISLKLLSSPAAPFQHQSSISICLIDITYKIVTWKSKTVSLSVYASTMCVSVRVCSDDVLWCVSINSLSESPWSNIRNTAAPSKELVVSSDLPSSSSSFNLPFCNREVTPSTTSFSFFAQCSSFLAFFLIHLQSLSSVLLSLTDVFLFGEGPKLDTPLLSASAALLHSRILQASGQPSPLASSSFHPWTVHLSSLLFNSLPYSFLFCGNNFT